MISRCGCSSTEGEKFLSWALTPRGFKRGSRPSHPLGPCKGFSLTLAQLGPKEGLPCRAKAKLTA